MKNLYFKRKISARGKTVSKVCKDAGSECIWKIGLITFIKKKNLTYRKEVINFNG